MSNNVMIMLGTTFGIAVVWVHYWLAGGTFVQGQELAGTFIGSLCAGGVGATGSYMLRTR